MTSRSKKDLIKKADREFSKFIIARDGYCILCGRTTDLDCGHLHRKKKTSVRWDPDNAAAICRECHTLSHADPDVMTRFREAIKGRIGEGRLDGLDRRAEEIVWNKYDEVYKAWVYFKARNKG